MLVLKRVAPDWLRAPMGTKKTIHAKEKGALSARAAHVWPDGSVARIISERR